RRRDRDPAGFRSRGFRRGADARTVRAGSAPARTSGQEVGNFKPSFPDALKARTRHDGDKTRVPTMRFMMLMIPLGYESAPPDIDLDPARVAAMMKYNEALKDAGVLITL